MLILVRPCPSTADRSHAQWFSSISKRCIILRHLLVSAWYSVVLAFVLERKECHTRYNRSLACQPIRQESRDRRVYVESQPEELVGVHEHRPIRHFPSKSQVAKSILSFIDFIPESNIMASERPAARMKITALGKESV